MNPPGFTPRMRERLRHFKTEPEIIGGYGEHPFHAAARGNAVKRRVDLDTGKMPGVKREHLARFRSSRIERAQPVFV